MFSGIIEEVGAVKSLNKSGNSASIIIEAAKVLEDVKVGDSIAVNGVCLTVTNFGSSWFSAMLSEETLTVTKFSSVKAGERVNLERALRLTDRLSGHIVSGHIDCVGEVKERIDENDFSVFYISFDRNFSHYVIKKGSIAIDGISLTVNEVVENTVRLNIIPHTLKETNLTYLGRSSRVNIEFDIIGKYIEKMLEKKSSGKETLTVDLLHKAGFIGGNIL